MSKSSGKSTSHTPKGLESMVDCTIVSAHIEVFPESAESGVAEVQIVSLDSVLDTGGEGADFDPGSGQVRSMISGNSSVTDKSRLTVFFEAMELPFLRKIPWTFFSCRMREARSAKDLPHFVTLQVWGFNFKLRNVCQSSTPKVYINNPLDGCDVSR